MKLDSRISTILAYLLLLIGILFYVSPYLPVLEQYDASYDLVFVAPSYLVAGTFAWLYTRGKVEKDSYVLLVPAVTFLVLAGNWLLAESFGIYELGVREVVLYGSISFFFVFGYTAKSRRWSYFGTSALAYIACVSIVALPESTRLGSWALDPPSLALTILIFIPVLVGIPVAVAVYLLSRNGMEGKRAYLAAAVLAYIVSIVVLPGPVRGILRPGTLFYVLVLVLSLGIPRAVVTYLLPDNPTKRQEFACVAVAVLAYSVWVSLFTVGSVLALYTWASAVVLALTFGAGTPLAVVAYLLSGRDSA